MAASFRYTRCDCGAAMGQPSPGYTKANKTTALASASFLGRLQCTDICLAFPEKMLWKFRHVSRYMSLLNGWLFGRNAAIPVSCSQTSKTPMAPLPGPSPSSRSHLLAPQSGLLCIGCACLQAPFLRRSTCQGLRWVHCMHVNVGAILPST